MLRDFHTPADYKGRENSSLNVRGNANFLASLSMAPRALGLGTGARPSGASRIGGRKRHNKKLMETSKNEVGRKFY